MGDTRTTDRFVRRTHAVQVACPDCGAEPGVLCTGARTNYRISSHHARHTAAIAAGYPVVDRTEARRRDTTTVPAADTTSSRGARQPRRKQARWNQHELTCAGPCQRHFPPATIRIVRHRDDWWCDRCYRNDTGHPHT